MNLEPIQANAYLVREKETIPIQVKCVSKYSLLIRFLNGKEAVNGAEFSSLLLQLNGERIEMGACRLISEPNIDGFTRRLIFIEEIYDLESLFLQEQAGETAVHLFEPAAPLGPQGKHSPPV
jgi:hypothetical protein